MRVISGGATSRARRAKRARERSRSPARRRRRSGEDDLRRGQGHRSGSAREWSLGNRTESRGASHRCDRCDRAHGARRTRLLVGNLSLMPNAGQRTAITEPSSSSPERARDFKWASRERGLAETVSDRARSVRAVTTSATSLPVDPGTCPSCPCMTLRALRHRERTTPERFLHSRRFSPGAAWCSRSRV